MAYRRRKSKTRSYKRASKKRSTGKRAIGTKIKSLLNKLLRKRR